MTVSRLTGKKQLPCQYMCQTIHKFKRYHKLANNVISYEVGWDPSDKKKAIQLPDISTEFQNLIGSSLYIWLINLR